MASSVGTFPVTCFAKPKGILFLPAAAAVFGVPGFLSSILFLSLNAAAVIVVHRLCRLGCGLIRREPWPCNLWNPYPPPFGHEESPLFSRRGLSSSGIHLSDCLVRRDHCIAVIRSERQLPGQELFDIESVLLVRIGSQEIVWVLCQIVFLRKERTDAAQLQDALAAVKHRQLVN